MKEKRPTMIWRGTKDVKTLYVRYHAFGIERTINTRVKGRPELFNPRNGRFETRGNISEAAKAGHRESNAALEDFFGRFNEFRRRVDAMGGATKEELVELESELLDLGRKRAEEVQPTAMDGKTRIADCIGLLDKRKGSVTASTIAMYKHNVKTFNTWAVGNGLGSVGDFSASTIRRFISERSRTVGNAALRLEVASLKQFAKVLSFEGVIGDDAAERIANFKLSLRKETVAEKIALTEEEVEALWEVGLEGALCRARDIFLVQLETSQRISDINGLYCSEDSENAKLDNVDGVWMLTITQRKSGKRVTAPISERVYRLLESYGFRMPRMHVNHINKYVKRICRKCGGSFLDDVVVNEKRGGKVVSAKVLRADIVSTHTARRTCITRMLSNGVDIVSASMVSGHNSLATLMRYNKRSGLENARVVANIMKGGK